MFGRIKPIILLTLSVLALASCDKTIHEYPGEVDLKLTVECDLNLTPPAYFTTVECDPENGTSYVVRTQAMQPFGTRFTEDVCYRFVIDLYRVTSSHSVFVERRVEFRDVDYDKNTDPVIAQFDVTATQYKVLVWCDYVQDDIREAWYYNTDDLRKIVYSDIEVKDNNDKDVFTNMLNVDLTDYYYLEGDFEIRPDVLTLERPKGRYKCITTDADDYLKSAGTSIEDITAVVQYTQYVSAGYNVEEQKPNYFEPTRTYIAKPRIDEDGELELCYDYVFVNGKQTNVKINFWFYKGEVKIGDNGAPAVDLDDAGNPKGEEISHWTGIVVPLKRNMETIIEGRMLTTNFGTGGIGIDPGFEGEIVIPWGD